MYGGPWPTDSRFTQWINISVHGLNSLFAIFEIVFSAVSPPPFFSHLLMVLTGLSLYLGVAYMTRALQGIYVYEWMNPAWGWEDIVLHVFGYAAGMITIYSAVWGVMWARESLAKKTQVTTEDERVWYGSESSSESSSRRQSFGEKSLSMSKEVMVSIREV